jgi:hypothetical protein
MIVCHTPILKCVEKQYNRTVCKGAPKYCGYRRRPLITYDMIKGRDSIAELKSGLDFDTQCITWDSIKQAMKTQTGLHK